MAYQNKEDGIKATGKKQQIRNSTVDFLVFTKDAGEDGIEVRVQNRDVWLTQKAIARLFDVDRSVVTKHLKNIFESEELTESAVCAKFAQTADDGKTYQYKFYSLSAIIKWLSKKVKQVFIVTVWGLWYNDKQEKLYFFGGGENMLESVQWIIGRRNYVVDLVVVVEYII